jgi:outer membrane protein assembly factor BamB
VGDVVYAGSCSGVFSAIDRAKGRAIWRYDIKRDGNQTQFHSTPIATKERLYVATDGAAIGHVYAFDPKNGRVHWKYAHKGRDWSGFTGDVLLAGDRLIGVTVDEHVIALDAATGAEAWNQPVGMPRRRIGMSPALADGRFFTGSATAAVFALDARSGALLWKRQVDASPSTSIAALPDAIVVGTEAKTLYRLRPTDGAVLASLDLGAVPTDTPVVTSHGICVTTEKSLILVDAELRRIIWRAESKSAWTSPRPRLWRGAIIAGDRDGTVFAIDEATGTTIWSRKIADKAIRGIGSDEKTLYIGTIDGKLIALRP